MRIERAVRGDCRKPVELRLARLGRVGVPLLPGAEEPFLHCILRLVTGQSVLSLENGEHSAVRVFRELAIFSVEDVLNSDLRLVFHHFPFRGALTRERTRAYDLPLALS